MPRSPDRSRTATAALLLALAAVALAGCSTRLRTESESDRCADLINIAFPNAAIAVTKKQAAAATQESLATVIVQVAGERRNLPPNTTAPRDLAIECRFDGGVLTGLRWTAGPFH